MPAGPDNPLGQHALRLGIPGYLIHGTNRPFSIGMEVSHGCVRMYPEDIETLFEKVPTGTKVMIIEQPVKASWQEDTLYIEVHSYPSDSESYRPLTLSDAVTAITNVTPEKEMGRVDWQRVRAELTKASGTPVPVSAVPSVDPRQRLW